MSHFFMKTIYVYTGKGAYQAKDIENFLAVFDYDYIRLSEHDIDQLINPGILIVPGGQISAYLPAWGERGIEIIKNFVSSGGIYVGICSGVYVAGKSFGGIPGLNFFDKELSHIEHQSIIDVRDSGGAEYQLIAENGPEITDIGNGKVILTDNNGQTQAMTIPFGKGLVSLFSSHPEGSVFYGKLPQTFLGSVYFNKFLKNLLK